MLEKKFTKYKYSVENYIPIVMWILNKITSENRIWFNS